MLSLSEGVEQPLLGDRSDDNQSQTDFSEGIADSPGKADMLYALARIVGCCVSAAAAGWHDGCIGALIPYLQPYYGGVSDRMVSLVFIGSFTGYTLASLLNVTLSNELGLGRLIILGAAVQGVASAIIAFQPPFIAIAMSYAIAGFGLALQDAQYNTYIARLPDAATKLGIVHAIYGVGALLSPIAATLLMQAKVPPPLFYLTNFTWCIASMAVLLTGFGLSGRRSSGRQFQSTAENDEEVAPLKTVISSRSVWTALLFISLYTGAESGEAGWIVSFLIRERDGGVMSGYASAAFYGGLTSSRVMLLPLTAYLSENIAVALYTGIALVMQIIVWASQSLFINFFATTVCGFVMGPIYPVAVSIVTKATPHGYHPGALSLMACVGQSGSALFPFVVGSLAAIYGIKVLQPVMAALFVVMILLWHLVPRPQGVLVRSSFDPRPDSVNGGVDAEDLDGLI